MASFSISKPRPARPFAATTNVEVSDVSYLHIIMGEEGLTYTYAEKNVCITYQNTTTPMYKKNAINKQKCCHYFEDIFELSACYFCASFIYIYIVLFCFLVLWHIKLRGLFNAKAILVEEQSWYCLIHN